MPVNRRALLRDAARVRRKLRKLPDDIKGALASEMRKAGVEVQRSMRSFVNIGPVAPHVKFAIDYRLASGGLKVLVGLFGKDQDTFFYARFLEFGTKKMYPKPFLRPGWRAVREEVRQSVKDATSRAIRRSATATATNLGIAVLNRSAE